MIKEIAGITLLENETDAIVACKNLSPQAKEKMLLDLVWHLWQTNKDAQIAICRDYNTAKLIMESKDDKAH